MLREGSREAGEAERDVSGLHHSLLRLPLKVRTAVVHVHVVVLGQRAATSNMARGVCSTAEHYQ